MDRDDNLRALNCQWTFSVFIVVLTSFPREDAVIDLICWFNADRGSTKTNTVVLPPPPLCHCCCHESTTNWVVSLITWFTFGLVGISSKTVLLCNVEFIRLNHNIEHLYIWRIPQIHKRRWTTKITFCKTVPLTVPDFWHSLNPSFICRCRKAGRREGGKERRKETVKGERSLGMIGQEHIRGYAGREQRLMG